MPRLVLSTIWSVEREICNSADLLQVDFCGELHIECHMISTYSTLEAGRPKRGAFSTDPDAIVFIHVSNVSSLGDRLLKPSWNLSETSVIILFLACNHVPIQEL
ncbi:unnamed protein product, partial [Dicrocoelium dendriticum]